MDEYISIGVAVDGDLGNPICDKQLKTMLEIFLSNNRPALIKKIGAKQIYYHI
jgi:hypothetical protein